MNQIELNKIAMNFIKRQSLEVTVKLIDVLARDGECRSKQVGGRALHHIHNMALFNCLASINNFFITEDNSPDAVQQYTDFADTLRPKFLDIMEDLRDFRPTNGKTEEGQSQD
jgi:hypothetical protein